MILIDVFIKSYALTAFMETFPGYGGPYPASQGSAADRFLRMQPARLPGPPR